MNLRGQSPDLYRLREAPRGEDSIPIQDPRPPRLRPRPEQRGNAAAAAGPRTACALPLGKRGGRDGFTISLKGTIPHVYGRISQEITIKYQIH